MEYPSIGADPAFKAEKFSERTSLRGPLNAAKAVRKYQIGPNSATLSSFEQL